MVNKSRKTKLLFKIDIGSKKVITSLRMGLIFDLQRCEAATRRQVTFNTFVGAIKFDA